MTREREENENAEGRESERTRIQKDKNPRIQENEKGTKMREDKNARE